MSNYKAVLNPFTGQLQLVLDANLLKIKGTVDTTADLPLTGNTENDCYIVKDEDAIYTWNSTESSGTIDKWVNVGSVSSIDWSAITNKPTSTVNDIDDAVTKKHTQGTDQALDTGGASEVSAAQAKTGYTHSQVVAGNPHAVTKSDVGLANVDNKSEATIITDVKADVDVADAISKKHTQNTDQSLDSGGANEVSAAQAKKGYTHSQVASGNPHNVSKSDVSLGDVQNIKDKLDATSAPTVNDDVDLGYSVGSKWVDVSADKAYICLDNTDGAAVWTEVTQSGGVASVDGNSGKVKLKRTIILKVLSDDELLATGDGQMRFTVPSMLNGYNLVEAHAHVYNASSSGTPTFAIYNETDSHDMLSTDITIDANENDSKDATTQPVINGSYDDVATGDVIRIDCDVAGTGTQGLEVRLTFQLP